MTRTTRRPFIHWLAILALLVNALLPGWAHAARHGAAGGQASDLCQSSASPAGITAAKAGLAADPAELGHLVTSDPCCLVCLTHAGGPLLPAADTPPVPSPQPGAQALPTCSPLPGNGAVPHDAYAARAPPAA